jgi:hypothetical protein
MIPAACALSFLFQTELGKRRFTSEGGAKTRVPPAALARSEIGCPGAKASVRPSIPPPVVGVSVRSVPSATLVDPLIVTGACDG